MSEGRDRVHEDYRVPISEEVKDALNVVARRVEEATPDGYGFAILMFHLGPEPGAMIWLSNADREDMLKALGEFLTVHGRMS